MKKTFWVLLLLSFLVINPTTVNWVLAVFVGGQGPVSGFERATQYFTLNSYAFAASFAVIPYVALAAIAILSNLKNTHTGRVALYCALAAISIFLFWGYWGMQHALFTAEQTSSTSVLALIYTPIHAIWLSVVAGVLGYWLAKVSSTRLNRAP